jgi:hypothetical protein
VQQYSPEEVRFAQAGHGIGGPLIDSAAKGLAVTLDGVDEIQGRKAYHLKLGPAKSGDDVWIDAETWLDVRCDRTAEGPGFTERRVSTIYRDYRDVEGLQVPFLIETGGGQGATPDKMQIEKVVLNVPLEDSAFGSPLAPRRRTRP